MSKITKKQQAARDALAAMHAASETDNVKISKWDGDVDRKVYSERWVVYTKDEDGEWSEELDFDVRPRTSVKEIKQVAKAQLVAEYDPGLVIAEVEQKHGMYL